MRKNNVNLFSNFALACVLLTSLGAVQVARAQTAESQSTMCYQVTEVPVRGMVTTSVEPPVEVEVGDFFTLPPILVYRAPGTASTDPSGDLFKYEVNNLQLDATGNFFCSQTPVSCTQLSNECAVYGTCSEDSNVSCDPTATTDTCVGQEIGTCLSNNEFCEEEFVANCRDDLAKLDDAIITFEIAAGDACSEDGRGPDCDPDNNQQ